jgi:hypothetical protein
MYGSVIWTMTSSDNLRRLFRLQKRAARVILGVKVREERTVTLFEKLKWIPYYMMRLKLTINFSRSCP